MSAAYDSRMHANFNAGNLLLLKDSKAGLARRSQ